MILQSSTTSSAAAGSAAPAQARPLHATPPGEERTLRPRKVTLKSGETAMLPRGSTSLPRIVVEPNPHAIVAAEATEAAKAAAGMSEAELDAALLRRSGTGRNEPPFRSGIKYPWFKHPKAPGFLSTLVSDGLAHTVLGSKPMTLVSGSALRDFLSTAAPERTLHPNFVLLSDGFTEVVINKRATSATLESHPDVFGLPRDFTSDDVDRTLNQLCASNTFGIETMADERLGTLLGYGPTNSRRFAEQGRLTSGPQRMSLQDARASLGTQTKLQDFNALRQQLDNSRVGPYAFAMWDGPETDALLLQNKREAVTINARIDAAHERALKTDPTARRADVMVDLVLDTLHAR